MDKCCDVIIPVYNSPDWLALCVEAAVRSDISGCIRKIILVDDCSSQETQEEIDRLCNRFDLLISARNQQNSGFVKTCNRGFSLTDSDYILLLNSDCLLAEDTIARMIAHIMAEPSIGLICPLSNNAANLSIPIPSGMDYVKIDALLGCHLKGFRAPACTVVGNCLLITRACYNSVGNLDEAFGMGYGEETDYQFRAQKAGFSAVVAADTYVFHKSQMSFGSGEKLSVQKEKNRKLFFDRWGEEYAALMEKYQKIDPAIKAASILTTRNCKRYSNYQSPYFNDDFLRAVDEIDARYTPVRNADGEGIAMNYLEKVLFKLKGLAGSGLSVLKTEGPIQFIRRLFRYVRGQKVFDDALHPYSGVGVSSGKSYMCSFKDLLILDCCAAGTVIPAWFIERMGYTGIQFDIIMKDSFIPEMLKSYRGILLYGAEGYSLLTSDLCMLLESHHKALLIAEVSPLVNGSPFIPLSGVIVSSVEQKKQWEKIVSHVLLDLPRKTDWERYGTCDEPFPAIATLTGANQLRQFIFDAFSPNVAFVVPHSSASAGGISVVLQHCAILQDAGYDTFLINLNENEDDCVVDSDHIIWVLNGTITEISGTVDIMVATMWNTEAYLDAWQMRGKKYYFVQGFETDFYDLYDTISRQRVNATYFRRDIHYITMSPWCRDWLVREYYQRPALVRNGLNLEHFPSRRRIFSTEEKITILIEGNCELWSKNIDEAFQITNRLDENQFRVILLTNNGKAKSWYRYDAIYHTVPHDEVYKVYHEAHILLKTSLRESFSYPPLEMMATGGLVVAIQNDGNREFLFHEHNCLLYSQGNIDDAIEAINRLVQDEGMRESLIQNGYSTAKSRAWENFADEISHAYSMEVV